MRNELIERLGADLWPSDDAMCVKKCGLIREAIEALAAYDTDDRIKELREALAKISLGSKLGKEMFEQRVKARKGRLTWYAVNVLQDNLAAREGTAHTALKGDA
jgi:hypothetical protein